MNLNNIHSDIDFWTGTDTSSNSAFPVSKRITAINDAYRAVDDHIWEALSDWEYDDTNYDTLPIAVVDLVDGQDNYQLPSKARKLMNISVKDKNGEYQPLKIFDQSQLKGVDYEEYLNDEKGFPEKADLIGDAIVLRPTPSDDDVTISNGLKIMVSRDIEEFDLEDADKEPGFSKHYHRLLSLMPSYQYLIANDANYDKLNRISSMIDKIIGRLKAYSTAKTQYKQVSIRPSSFNGGVGDSKEAV